MNASYAKVMPKQDVVISTFSAIAHHEIGNFLELPFAGPYTSARYEIVSREVNGIDAKITATLVPGQRF